MYTKRIADFWNKVLHFNRVIQTGISFIYETVFTFINKNQKY